MKCLPKVKSLLIITRLFYKNLFRPSLFYYPCFVMTLFRYGYCFCADLNLNFFAVIISMFGIIISMSSNIIGYISAAPITYSPVLPFINRLLICVSLLINDPNLFCFCRVIDILVNSLVPSFFRLCGLWSCRLFRGFFCWRRRRPCRPARPEHSRPSWGSAPAPPRDSG